MRKWMAKDRKLENGWHFNRTAVAKSHQEDLRDETTPGTTAAECLQAQVVPCSRAGPGNWRARKKCGAIETHPQTGWKKNWQRTGCPPENSESPKNKFVNADKFHVERIRYVLVDWGTWNRPVLLIKLEAITLPVNRRGAPVFSRRPWRGKAHPNTSSEMLGGDHVLVFHQYFFPSKKWCKKYIKIQDKKWYAAPSEMAGPSFESAQPRRESGAAVAVSATLRRLRQGTTAAMLADALATLRGSGCLWCLDEKRGRLDENGWSSRSSQMNYVEIFQLEYVGSAHCWFCDALLQLCW